MAYNVYKDLIREIPLAEIVEIRTARKPERVEEYPFDSSLPYVDIRMLESGVPNRFAEDYRYTIGGGDLVMVKDGYRSGKVFRTKKEGVAASTLAILSPRHEDVLTDYLYCYLAYCYEDLQNNKKGDFIGHLDLNYLKQLKVPVPDVSKQEEIAEQYQRIESMTNETREKVLQLKELSIKLENKELKEASENLNLQVENIMKSWLHQFFNKSL